VRQNDAAYLARWLVEPITLEPLRADGHALVTQAGHPVPLTHGVPVFGRDQLSTAQLAELSHAPRRLAEQRADPVWLAAPESSYAWSRPWLDEETLSAPKACVVCLGAPLGDDLPDLRVANKFNVDHLADVYAELAAPEVASQSTTFVSSPAETLPFATGTVDAVYSRSGFDRVHNPLLVLEEVHRVLKPAGTFLFACHYDSALLDVAGAVVESDFLDRFVASLFVERHRQLEPVPPHQVSVGQAQTQWLCYVGSPKPGGRLPLDRATIEWSARLASSFQQALAERVAGDSEKSKSSFAATLVAPPVTPTDAHRQVFAALQLLAMFDKEALLAAAHTIRDHGLGPDWRSVANLVLGHYGWSLDDLPSPPRGQLIRCPLLEEWKWYATIRLSATALGRGDSARALGELATAKRPLAASAWMGESPETRDLDAARIGRGSDGRDAAWRAPLRRLLTRRRPRQDALQTLARRVGDDWKDSEYYAEAEAVLDDDWEALIWPQLRDCDFTSVVEVAAGHGRHSEKLRHLTPHLVLVDINRENLDVLRQRFAGARNITYVHNDGVSLTEIPDRTVTLVYTFDAMVHFDSDVVRAYLREFARILHPGGRALCHYSNYSAEPTGSYRTHPGWRNFMSRELFEHYAWKEGLTPVVSQLIRGGVDGLTVLEKSRP